MPGEVLGPAPVIVALPAVIDVTCQDRPYDQLYAAFASGAAVVVADFSGTAFCDSSSLRHLVGIRHRAVARGAELRLVIPPGGAVHRAVDLTEIDRAVPIYPDIRAAAAGAPVRNLPAPGSPRDGVEKAADLADIADLVAASHLHIQRWQAWLGELRRQLGSPPPGPDLTATWETLAAYMDLHMKAEDEVCGLAIYGASPHGLALLRDAHDDHNGIRELISEASLQPPGSPLWWQLVTAVSTAWRRLCEDEQHSQAADHLRRADPVLRQRLAQQWRAFREASIRDSYRDAPLELPTCQLRQQRPAPPRLADIVFSPLSCTCPACTHELGGLLNLPDLPARRAGLSIVPD